MTNPPDPMLDDLLAQMRASVIAPDAALMARIIADADAVQPVRAATPLRRRRIGPWAQLRQVIGGWPGAGGLVAATLAGVWLGVAQPPLVQDLARALGGDAIAFGLTGDGFVTDDDLFDNAGAFGDG